LSFAVPALPVHTPWLYVVRINRRCGTGTSCG
jgi:hypothetical protein